MIRKYPRHIARKCPDIHVIFGEQKQSGDFTMSKPRRNAFTLIELVVVIMLIAILGAIAAPRLMGTRKSALDSQVIKSLNNIRNSISMYAADNGGKLPGADGDEIAFKSDVTAYLRGNFPKVGVGPLAEDNTKNDLIRMTNASGALIGNTEPTTGWAYNYTTGEFIIDYDGTTITDPNVNYDDL